MNRSALLLASILLAAPLVAQQPPGPRPGGPGGPDGPQGFERRPQGPPPERDRAFLYGQAMRALDEKASILIEQNRPDLAIEELKKVFTFDVPREHPVFEAKAHLIGRLATTYAITGRKKEAVETIQKLIAEVPPGSVAEATAWLEAGTVYKQAGMPDEALKAFDRAIELSQKLAKAPPRGPAGRPPMPPNGPGAPQPR